MTQALPGTPFHAAAARAGDPEDWGPLDEATGAWQIHEKIRKLYVLY